MTMEFVTKKPVTSESLPASETAIILGVGLPEIVEYWVKTGYINGIRKNGETRIPRSEINRIKDDERVRSLREYRKLQEAVPELPGDDQPLSLEELAYR